MQTIGAKRTGSNRLWPHSGCFFAAQRPAARAERLDTSLASLFHRDGAFVPDTTYARISTRGRGRKWQASTAIGAWRDFAELDLDNDAAIRLRRPFRRSVSVLQPGRDVVTQDWSTLKTCLALFAQAWDPARQPTASAASRTTRRGSCSPPSLPRPSSSRSCVRRAIIPKIGRNGFELSSRTSAAFMIASAVDHFVDRQLLRRCQVCSRWFPIRRRPRVLLGRLHRPGTQGISKMANVRKHRRKWQAQWHLHD